MVQNPVNRKVSIDLLTVPNHLSFLYMKSHLFFVWVFSVLCQEWRMFSFCLPHCFEIFWGIVQLPYKEIWMMFWLLGRSLHPWLLQRLLANLNTGIYIGNFLFFFRPSVLIPGGWCLHAKPKIAESKISLSKEKAMLICKISHRDMYMHIQDSRASVLLRICPKHVLISSIHFSLSSLFKVLFTISGVIFYCLVTILKTLVLPLEEKERMLLPLD